MGVLRARVGGVWVDVTALTGPTGPTGPIGLTGPAGPSPNFIDNAAMLVAQRGITSPNTPTSGLFWLDRWQVAQGAIGGQIQVSQTVDGPANTQFNRCLKVLQQTINASPAVGDFQQVVQSMEGQFIQSLLWGTSSARPITLSFWVKSNVPGTYIVELIRNEGTSRSIAAAYTVLASATWEFKTVTFPGDTTTPITNDAANRLQLGFWMATGTSFTSGGSLQTAWGTTTTNLRAFGQSVNLWTATSNYWQVTGVQLEDGSTATACRVAPYDADLRKCQRYFYESNKQLYSTIPSVGVVTAATTAVVAVYYPGRMRAVPTITKVGALRLIDQFGAAGWAVTTLADAASGQTTQDCAYLNVTCTGATMTGGRTVFLQGNNDATAAIRLSAEI